MNEQLVPVWERLHREAVVVDIHAHPSLKVALFRHQLSHRYRTPKNMFWPPAMRTDFAKLHKGGVDVLFSAIYVPEAPILKDIPLLRVLKLLKRKVWKEIIEPPYFQAAVRAVDEIETQIDNYNSGRHPSERQVTLVRTTAALESVLAQGDDAPIAFIHTIEGAHNLQGPKSGKTAGLEDESRRQEIEAEILSNLETAFQKGVASLTLAHFFPNRVVSPVFPFPEMLLPLARRNIVREHDPSQGLSAIGEKVVERMLELGMIIDVAHCTPAARARIYEIVESENKVALVIASHVGAYAINPSLYNLQDWEIKWIADHGGVVGVIFMNYWLMPHETKLGLNFISRTIEHIVEVGGIGSAALGSDFDGFTDPPDDLSDASQMHKLTQRLLSEMKAPGQKRYSEDDVRDILGGNALRVLKEGWGKE